MTRLHIERTTSYQLEDSKGGYCVTTYSRPDALLIKPIAERIPNLVCLPKNREKHQPKGIYITVKDFPQVEVYDGRLAKQIRKIRHKLQGEP